MEKNYNHKEIEPKIIKLWEGADYFTPKINPAKKPFSIFLTPPNASGPMHIGNALMVAIQDILARYHRSKGTPTLWVPSTDHGGYETQVTFERELEKAGRDKNEYTDKELYSAIEKFVDQNNSTIKKQIKNLGASVDWTRTRFTLDEASLKWVTATFKKMVSDGLIYRRPYMVHYCPKCETLLSDIELREKKGGAPLYFLKFNFANEPGFLSIPTFRPEYIYSTTHVLVHPLDQRFAHLIGKTIINPATGDPVEIIESKRKFNAQEPEPYLKPFSPSFDKYDYEYTLRNSLPSRNLIGWDGKMIERRPGLTPEEARKKEIEYLNSNSLIDRIEEDSEYSTYLCKSGHITENMVVLTWFLELDNKQTPIREPAIRAVKEEGLIVLPRWREKGLLEWLGKMPDWPLARQNVWGIKIPIWYEVNDPSRFMVWWRDKDGQKQIGKLSKFLESGIRLEEIEIGLERIYAEADTLWVIDREDGKKYLPETDRFDTWFSSGQWATNVYAGDTLDDFKYFYPSDSIVIGHDLLRLSVSRKILLSHYSTGKLPFKLVYLHRLVKGADGQKMSKSLGNAVSIEEYLEKYGADVTRMALTSFSMQQDDFILDEDRLRFFSEFGNRLWKMGRVVELANVNNVSEVNQINSSLFSSFDKRIMAATAKLIPDVSASIEKYSLVEAEEKACNHLNFVEEYVEIVKDQHNIAVPLSVLKKIFKDYLIILHPFMPFLTEELNNLLYKDSRPLASTRRPK